MKSKMFNDSNRENILNTLGMGAAVERVKMGCCASCGVSVEPESFRNSISLKEFDISGLCQHCQDVVFGED